MNSLVPHLRCWEVPDGCTKTSSLFLTLFVDGENEVGKVTSVTPPKLTRKTDSYRGGGMMGAVSIDLGLDDSALDASFVMGEAVRALFLKYGGTIGRHAAAFCG